MTDAAAPAKNAPPDHPALGAVLSYCVPGLGQIYQGVLRKNPARLSKGIFFLVTLLGMFFYGMWLGEGKNVYLPRVNEARILKFQVRGIVASLWTRLHYLGQFWIGAAAWPAIIQYYHYTPYDDDKQSARFQITDNTLKALRAEDVPEQTVTALEKLKNQEPRTRDAFLDAIDQVLPRSQEDLILYHADRGHPLLGRFEREIPEDKANRIQQKADMGRSWDIAWVYTVIAGLLNILVIYDAYAGPVQTRPEPHPTAPTTTAQGEKP